MALAMRGYPPTRTLTMPRTGQRLWRCTGRPKYLRSAPSAPAQTLHSYLAAIPIAAAGWQRWLGQARRPELCEPVRALRIRSSKAAAHRVNSPSRPHAAQQSHAAATASEEADAAGSCGNRLPQKFSPNTQRSRRLRALAPRELDELANQPMSAAPKGSLPSGRRPQCLRWAASSFRGTGRQRVLRHWLSGKFGTGHPVRA